MLTFTLKINWTYPTGMKRYEEYNHLNWSQVQRVIKRYESDPDIYQNLTYDYDSEDFIQLV